MEDQFGSGLIAGAVEEGITEEDNCGDDDDVDGEDEIDVIDNEEVPHGVLKYLAGNVLPSHSAVICGLAKNQVYSYSEVAFVISEEEAKTVEVLEGTTALITKASCRYHPQSKLLSLKVSQDKTMLAPMGSIYVSAAKFLKAIIVNIPAQSEVGFDTCDNTRSRL
ncbi:hypothetical protein WN943_005782 [Citrus x changshan-huyou]